MNIRPPHEYAMRRKKPFVRRLIEKNTANIQKSASNHTKIERNHAILGIGLLAAVVSITYSSVVIYVGVDTTASRIALFPQMILGAAIFVFAITILSKALSKHGEPNG